MNLKDELEFADLRGYELEIEEIEAAMKEHAATIGVIERARTFGKAVFGKDRAAFLQMATDARLSEEETLYVQEAVALLEEIERLFESRSDAAAFERIEYTLTSHGLDTYPLLRILQATASRGILPNFLRAENAAVPHRRAQAIERKELQRARAWQEAFHACGLDGEALQKLLKMKPSPAFGRLLKDIQAYAKGQKQELPEISKEAHGEIVKRIEKVRLCLSN